MLCVSLEYKNTVELSVSMMWFVVYENLNNQPPHLNTISHGVLMQVATGSLESVRPTGVELLDTILDKV